jgi:hypothetical protein
MLFFHFFSVLDYALPFTEFYRRNDENRIGNTTKIKGNLSSAFEKADSQSNIYYFSDIFFTFAAKKMSLSIGQQRSILKIQKPPVTLI